MNSPLSRILKTVLLLILASAAAACTKTKKTDEATPSATSPSRTLNLYIWAEYTSPSLLEAFTKRTGIKIQESNYSSNEELLAKLQAGATGFDIAVPSDYMVSIMSKLKLVEELDKAKIPNHKNIEPWLMGKNFDPSNTWSLPYAWTITGIAVNRTQFKEPVSSWKDLFTLAGLKGRIALLDDVREVIGAAHKFNGASLNSVNPDDLKKAKTTLAQVKERVKAFNSTPADLLVSGEVLAAHMYSGEAYIAARDSGRDIEFIVPTEGATLAIDNVVILKDAPNREAAYEFLNFLYEAASNVDFVTRMLAGPVVAGIRDQLPEQVRKISGLFPSPELLKQCEMIEDIGEFTAEYDRVWAETKASSH